MEEHMLEDRIHVLGELHIENSHGSSL